MKLRQELKVHEIDTIMPMNWSALDKTFKEVIENTKCSNCDKDFKACTYSKNDIYYVVVSSGKLLWWCWKDIINRQAYVEIHRDAIVAKRLIRYRRERVVFLYEREQEKKRKISILRRKQYKKEWWEKNKFSQKKIPP